MASINTEQM